MSVYRPEDEWLQWLDEPPAKWTRYVPVTGTWTGVSAIEFQRGLAIGIPDEAGMLDGRWIYSGREGLVDVSTLR